MSRVLRSPQVGAATELFTGDEPRFYGEAARAAIDAEVARAFEAGRREGFAAGRADTAAAVQRLETALRAALADAARLRTEAVDETIAAALSIAEFVVGGPLVDTAGPLADRIAAAVADLDEPTATVFVSPVDWDVLAPVIQVPSGITIDRDPALRPGEARIIGPWATVELTRAAALAQAREALG